MTTATEHLVIAETCAHQARRIVESNHGLNEHRTVLELTALGQLHAQIAAAKRS